MVALFLLLGPLEPDHLGKSRWHNEHIDLAAARKQGREIEKRWKESMEEKWKKEEWKCLGLNVTCKDTP